MRDLSILIPARNEQFLAKTIEDILENKRGNTEVIAVLDGAWADPPVKQHPDVTIVLLMESIGQRAATNLAARLSDAKYVMKCDAHCAFDEGFDIKLMADMQPNWTVVPKMYNLHAFDWVCKKCGWRKYQGPTPEKCEKCGGKVEREIIWKPKKSPETTAMRFDKDLRFQYWGGYKKRQKGDLVETMSLLGACWMLTREKYWELNICDEEHGGWGQQGTEVACKTWLSGGKLICNKKTWFAHMFRTQGGDFGFPYRITSTEVSKARKHSKELWLNDKWPKAKHKLQWLIEKFAPIQGWHDETKGIVYYTDNQAPVKIARACQGNLKKMGLPIVSVSLKPMPHFGENIHLPGKRGYLQMFKQILAGLEASKADVIFFCEHDILYPKEHFDFIPPDRECFYYNENVWFLRLKDGHALHYDAKQLSGLCAYREPLIKHFRERVTLIEKEGFSRRIGFEPMTHGRIKWKNRYRAEGWKSAVPIIDIKHGGNLVKARWSKDQFRNQKYTKGWKESDDEIPEWGRISDIIRLVS